MNRKCPLHEDGLEWNCGRCRIAAQITGVAIPMPVLRPKCRHEGTILEWCHACQSEARHVRECEKHDTKCTRGLVSTLVRSCLNCPDHESER